MYSNLSKSILSFSYIPEQNQLRFDLRNGSRLYIVYNDFEEYANQYNFSDDPLDRVRFDAMDKKWDVPTPPHHFHPRFNILCNFKHPRCVCNDKTRVDEILRYYIKGGIIAVVSDS